MQDVALKRRELVQVPELKLGLLRLPVLGRLRRKANRNELDVLLHRMERDKVFAELHHNANVALLGVNIDPNYVSMVRM